MRKLFACLIPFAFAVRLFAADADCSDADFTGISCWPGDNVAVSVDGSTVPLQDAIDDGSIGGLPLVKTTAEWEACLEASAVNISCHLDPSATWTLNDFTWTPADLSGIQRTQTFCHGALLNRTTAKSHIKLNSGSPANDDGWDVEFDGCQVTASNDGSKGFVESYASGGAGYTEISSTDHGLSNGDRIVLYNTYQYEGQWTVSSATTDTFEIQTDYLTPFSTIDFSEQTADDGLVLIQATAHGLADGAYIDITGTEYFDGQYRVDYWNTNYFRIPFTWLYGSITAFADAGGGEVTVTSAAHGMANGDTLTISATTNYNGTYTIGTVATDTFRITHSWDGDDATGRWDQAGDEVGTVSIYIPVTKDTHEWAEIYSFIEVQYMNEPHRSSARLTNNRFDNSGVLEHTVGVDIQFDGNLYSVFFVGNKAGLAGWTLTTGATARKMGVLSMVDNSLEGYDGPEHCIHWDGTPIGTTELQSEQAISFGGSNFLRSCGGVFLTTLNNIIGELNVSKLGADQERAPLQVGYGGSLDLDWIVGGDDPQDAWNKGLIFDFQLIHTTQFPEYTRLHIIEGKDNPMMGINPDAAALVDVRNRQGTQVLKGRWWFIDVMGNPSGTGEAYRNEPISAIMRGHWANGGEPRSVDGRIRWAESWQYINNGYVSEKTTTDRVNLQFTEADSPVTVTPAHLKGALLRSTGASAQVVFNLPNIGGVYGNAEVGDPLTICNMTTGQSVKLCPDASDMIVPIADAVGECIISGTAQGECVELEAISTPRWVIKSQEGSWAEETP